MKRKQITPVHPGEYLRELLDELEISQYKLARDIGVAPVRISYLINAQRSVTAELDCRLGRYFRQSPRFWLNLQARYDMDVTADRIGARVLKEVRPFRAVA
jgi:addiction module HigA family antidote